MDAMLRKQELARLARLRQWGAAFGQRVQVRADSRRNAARRARNAILRELCGTSARAAREDMGL